MTSTNVKKKSLNNLYGYLYENVIDDTKTIDDFTSSKKNQTLEIVYNNDNVNNIDNIDNVNDGIINVCKPSKKSIKSNKIIATKIAVVYINKKRHAKKYFGSKTARPKSYKTLKKKSNYNYNCTDTDSRNSYLI